MTSCPCQTGEQRIVAKRAAIRPTNPRSSANLWRKEIPTSLIAGLICFIILVGVAVVFVLRTRSYAARIVLALLLLPPAGFCVFGFAATFEPMDAVTQWSFRIGYVVVGVGLAGTSLMLLIRRPVSSTGE